MPGKAAKVTVTERQQEILPDESHRIRFVYRPKHSSWLNQIETVFGVVMRKVETEPQSHRALSRLDLSEQHALRGTLSQWSPRRKMRRRHA
jgi:transposase